MVIKVADISLLFGVQREGGVGQGSEATIRSQLQDIINTINATPFKIKFEADEASLNTFVKKVSDAVSAAGLGTNTLSSGFATVTHQVGATVNTIHTMNQAVNATNLEKITAAISGLNAVKIPEQDIANIITRLEQLGITLTNAQIQYKNLGKEGEYVPNLIIEGVDRAGNAIRQNLRFDNKEKLTQDLTNIVIKLAEIEKKAKSTGTSGASGGQKLSDEFRKAKIAVTEYYNTLTQVHKNNWAVEQDKNGVWYATAEGYEARVDKLNRVTQAFNTATQASQSFTTAEKQAFNEYNTSQAEKYRVAVERVTEAERIHKETSKDVNSLMRSYTETITKNDGNLRKWSAAAKSSNSDAVAAYNQLQDALNEARVARENFESNPSPENLERYTQAIDKLKNTSSKTKDTLQALGYNTKTLGERLKGLAQKFATWFSLTRVIMAAYRTVRKMITAVIDLDTAMTELKKVTDETDSTYNHFLVNAASRAKKLGASLFDVVTASADFARLGYTISESEALADAAIVYKNVGDGIEDINDASESVIATMQAFGVEANDVMQIVDKFNEVGNNYAISSKGVGDALLRSAAAMYSANNTLDETIALAAAANTIVQDPEKVGTTLKTVSMFLRAAKTEAEEAGESTEGMANSISELRGELLQLTGGKVDIQIDEDTYKSTYQILKELSLVWNDLTDITQANITELVGGKRNSNVVSALLENFSIAEEAVETSAEAAGSALKENEKFLESINGKIQQFKAGFEELANNLIGSDIVKFVVDFGAGLLNVINGIIQFIDNAGGLKTILLGIASTLMVLNAQWIAHKVALIANLIVTKLSTAIQGTKKILDALRTAIPNCISAWRAYATGTTTAAGATVSASTAMQATIPVIGLLLAAITAIVGVVSFATNKVEESRDAAIDAGKEASSLSSSISDLTNEYINLYSSMADSIDAHNDLTNTQEKLRKQLKLTESQLSILIEKYGSAREALIALSQEQLKQSERELRSAVPATESKLLEKSKQLFNLEYITGKRNQYKPDIWETIGEHPQYKGQGQRDTYRAILALQEAGYKSQTPVFDSWDPDNLDAYVGSFEYTFDDYDPRKIEDILTIYAQLGDMLDIVGDSVGHNNLAYEGLSSLYDSLTPLVSEYTDSISNLNNNLAEQYMLENLRGKEIPKTKAEFETFREEVINNAIASKEFVGSQEDVANAVDGFLSEQASFTEFYKTTSEIIPKSTAAVNDFVSQLSEVGTLIDGFDKLGAIYEDIQNGDTFDWKSIIADEGFIETFGNLGNAYSDFIKTVSSSHNDLSTCQSAFDNLTKEYILNSGALNNITDASRDAAVAMLEQMGVANASQMVDTQLTYQKERLRIETELGTESDYESIYAKYKEAEAGSAAQQVLAELALTKLQVSESNINCDADIDNLISLANTANATTASLERLAKAKSLQTALVAESTRVENYIKEHNITDPRGLSAIRSQERVLESQIEELLNTPLDFEKFDASMFEGVVFDGGAYNSSDTSSNSDKSNTETKESEFERLYKKHQHFVAMNKESTSDYLDWLDKAYKEAYKKGEIELDDYYAYEEEVYEGRQELFKDFLNDKKHEISLRENYEGDSKAVLALNKELMVATEKEIAKARANGLTDNDDYIQDLQSEWQGFFDYIKKQQDESLEDAKSSIDELVEYRIDMIKQELEDEQDVLDKKLDAIKDFYDKQKELLQDQRDEEQYAKDQTEKRQTVADLEAELAMLESDNSAWAQKRKLELREELNIANEDLEEFERDHALEIAIDKLESAYSAEESRIQAEMDALEDKLNDPKALFNQALAEIADNTDGIGHDGTLFYEMIKYNRKHGSGNDEDVIKLWENAYLASSKYKDIHGEYYNGFIVPNATGYKKETESLDDTVIVKLDKKSKGYASGTTSASKGLHEVFENGYEHVFVSSDGSRYKLFENDDKVLTSQATKFLYDFAESEGSSLFDLFTKFTPDSLLGKITSTPVVYEINAGDIIIEGNADNHTVSEIRRAQRNNVDYILKAFTKLSK